MRDNPFQDPQLFEKIEFDIGRQGYFQHPTLGKLRANCVPRWTLILSLVIAGIFGFAALEANFKTAAMQELAVQNAQRANALQMQLHEAKTDLASARRCQDTLDALSAQVARIETVAQAHQQDNPAASDEAMMIARLMKAIL